MQEMNKEVRENTIRKVAKLIALANDSGATGPEAELAMKRAEQIMTKYAIEMTEVMSKRKTKMSVEEMTTREDADCWYYSKGYSDWELTLGWGISPIFNVESIMCHNAWDVDKRTGKFEAQPKMAFMGVPEDVALVVYFFDYCQNEIGVACEIYDKRVTIQNNFAKGMVGRIIDRLKTLYKRVSENLPADCTAIVLYNKDLAKGRKNKEFNPKSLVRHRGTSTKMNQDYINGVKAGDNLHLSSNRDQVN